MDIELIIRRLRDKAGQLQAHDPKRQEMEASIKHFEGGNLPVHPEPKPRKGGRVCKAKRGN